MSEEMQQYENYPAIADDTLIQIAKQAEARIEAVVKIKQMALKVTNPSDWTDQQGKPYLQASGSEKIANLFNVSWQIDEPQMETEADGTITYIYKGRFSLAGRSIEVEGSRSSRDTFFKKYEYDKAGNKTGEKPLDRRDLKMAAMTNLLGNGITRLLGIRNLTWADLEQYANIKQGDIKGKVEYKKAGQPPPSQPQSKSEQAGTTEGEQKDFRAEITKMIAEMTTSPSEAIMMLRTLSGFQGKHRETGESQWVDGKDKAEELSDSAAKVTYGKVKKEYLAWKEKQGKGE